jgi:hypothetical protein
MDGTEPNKHLPEFEDFGENTQNKVWFSFLSKDRLQNLQNLRG